MITEAQFDASEVIEQAELTPRCVGEGYQEWQAIISVEGIKYYIYFVFETEAVKDVEPEDYDWTYDNITRIVPVDE